MAFPVAKTLREYYSGDIDHTETSANWGYVLAMWDAFEQGQVFITGNLAQIQADIHTAAVKGQQKFTLSYETTYQTANLRLNGPHLKSYFAGIQFALQQQAIYWYETMIVLNISDTSITKVDINVDFGSPKCFHKEFRPVQTNTANPSYSCSCCK